MRKRVAVIDCGTNTFNLVIADVSGHGAEMVSNHKISVKLGEGGLTQGLILPAAYARGMSGLEQFHRIIQLHHVEHTMGYATSALRGASNGNAFLKEAFERFGFFIRCIDGNREAELIHRGVLLGMNLGKQPVCIMDIGGGSTECVLATGETLLWKNSFPLGAARLLERFKPSDPLTKKEAEIIMGALRLDLQPLQAALHQFPSSILVGSSGSFDTLAEVIAYKTGTPINLEAITSLTFDLAQFHDTSEHLLYSTLEERLSTPGIIPIRAEMMPMAILLMHAVWSLQPFRELMLSTYSLKEGAIWEMMHGLEPLN
jgi:exopolyphosphatase/guanosine-5'-triphosphate,3'-diphosphate pyrophosphatase